MSQELENAIEGINAKSAQINANEVEVKAVSEKANSLELELKGAKDEIVKLSEKVAENAKKEIIEKDIRNNKFSLRFATIFFMLSKFFNSIGLYCSE